MQTAVRTQDIYKTARSYLHLDSTAVAIRELVKKAILDLVPEITETALLETVTDTLPNVANLLKKEANRAIHAGVPIFEVVGRGSDTVKGFSVPMAGDDSDLLKLRNNVGLSETIKAGIRELDATQFETFCVLLLSQFGGKPVEVTSASRDGGIDFTISFNLLSGSQQVGDELHSWWKDSEKITKFMVIGQAKHYPDGKIGPNVVRELVGSMFLRSNTHPNELRGTLGMVITSGGFTQESNKTGRRAGVVLLNGDWIAAAVIGSKLGIIENGGKHKFNLNIVKAKISEY